MEEAGDEPLFCERAAGIDIGKQVVSVTIRVPSDTRRGGRQNEQRARSDRCSREGCGESGGHHEVGAVA